MGLCQCLITSPPYVFSCKGGDCIYTPSMLVRAVDSVTPCGDVGIITLTDKVKTNLCTSKALTPLYEIIGKSANVATTTINSSQITFTLSITPASTATITYKVTCGKYSSIGEITIVPKSVCTNISIPQGKVCHPCTGALTDAPVNVVITSPAADPTSDIIIN